MRRLFFFLPCLLLLFASCTVQTGIMPELSIAPHARDICPTLFPQGHYQFVHLIEFSMPGGNTGSAMGVSVIQDRAIHSVLMTVEGFVFFAADLTDTLTVARAVPPFDKPGFASGMMADIKTLFLRPQGKIVTGFLQNGEQLCRTVSPDNSVVDTFIDEQHCVQLKRYSSDSHILQTEVKACSFTPQSDMPPLPKKLALQSYQAGGYLLKMTLVSAEKL